MTQTVYFNRAYVATDLVSSFAWDSSWHTIGSIEVPVGAYLFSWSLRLGASIEGTLQARLTDGTTVFDAVAETIEPPAILTHAGTGFVVPDTTTTIYLQASSADSTAHTVSVAYPALAAFALESVITS